MVLSAQHCIPNISPINSLAKTITTKGISTRCSHDCDHQNNIHQVDFFLYIYPSGGVVEQQWNSSGTGGQYLRTRGGQRRRGGGGEVGRFF